MITQAIKYNRSLTNLDIRNCPIDDDGLGLIGKLLLDAECSCHVRYVSCAAVNVPPACMCSPRRLRLPTGSLRFVRCL